MPVQQLGLNDDICFLNGKLLIGDALSKDAFVLNLTMGK